MTIITQELRLNTRGHTDVQDITLSVSQIVQDSQLNSGIVTIFCPGSTGGLTTIEYEHGVITDLKEVLDTLAPPDRDYLHHQRWGDDNGHSHIRAALFGPSLVIPFSDRQLTLGTWQQIVFMDFDTRQRNRRLIVQVMGE